MANVKCCIFIMVISFAIYKPAHAVVPVIEGLLALTACLSGGTYGSFYTAAWNVLRAEHDADTAIVHDYLLSEAYMGFRFGCTVGPFVGIAAGLLAAAGIINITPVAVITILLATGAAAPKSSWIESMEGMALPSSEAIGDL